MIAALLDHLWQSSLFAGAIAAMMPLLRKQSASLRFALWFAASLKFLVPFAAVAALGRMLLDAVTPDVAAPLLSAIRPAATPFHLAAPLVSPAPAALPAAELAAIVWGFGLCAIVLLCLSRWLELRAALHAASPVPLDAPVPVRSAASFLEPGLVGIWRPVILLPRGLSQQLTPAEMDAILAHELCHLARRDNLWAAMHMVVEALFWFHPLVWWIGGKLVEERERACDESVVAGGASPLVYAQGILKICRFYVQTPLACASGVSGADLQIRLGAIMAGAPAIRLHPAKTALLGLGASLALLLPLAAGMLGAAPVNILATRLAANLASAMATPAPVSLPAHPPVPPKAKAKLRAHVPQAQDAPAVPEPRRIVAHVDADPLIIFNTPPQLAPEAGAEEIRICRKPQQLPGSHLSGPPVCLLQSEWDRLNAKGLVLMPDGRELVGSYEKRRSLAVPGCPWSNMVGGATTAMGSIFSICY